MEVDPNSQLQALALPSELPAPVWTRTAPASLVDERGGPLQVLRGHHTRLELRYAYADRALVYCGLCQRPVEGWIQSSIIMPEGHEPTREDLADDRLSLALYAAQLRRAALAGQPLPGWEGPSPPTEALISLLDLGFARQDDRAIAPASGAALATGQGTLRLALGAAHWSVAGLDLSGGEPGGDADDAAEPVHRD